jgi:hypothetical protein
MFSFPYCLNPFTCITMEQHSPFTTLLSPQNIWTTLRIILWHKQGAFSHKVTFRFHLREVAAAAAILYNKCSCNLAPLQFRRGLLKGWLNFIWRVFRPHRLGPYYVTSQKTTVFCEIWASYRGVAEGSTLLGCKAFLLFEYLSKLYKALIVRAEGVRKPMISVPLSPWRGGSWSFGWWNGLQYRG